MKYMGSKNRIAKYIVPIIQSYIDKTQPNYYIEPFVGGANIIDKINYRTKIGVDNNDYLIKLLKQAQHDISVFPETYDEQFYQAVKKNPENYEPWLVGLVGFCTYGGKWFGGYPRVKKGNRDIVNENIRNIIKQAPNLAGIYFHYNDYQNLILRNCVIYCDPPYRNSTNGYKTKFDHSRFYGWCKEQCELGSIVLVSEYYMPPDFKCIWKKESSVNFDSNRSTKQTRTEKLFILEP